MSEAIPRTMPQPVLVEPGRIEERDDADPAPGRGELLVRVEAALTCGTDVKTFRRGHPRIPLPAPFGHEMAGTVVAVGKDVVALQEGDALACVPTAPCGECTACRRGRENLCAVAIEEMRFGAFSPYVLLPDRIVRRSVFARPATMSATTAAALEPLACVVHGASRIPLVGARSVLILGDGPIALLFLQL
ncbi:MAG: alcohol dehydrogenase catalytic domain-containing protein, partial [Gemmatimonadetes bacterium]|nr:alcohol dehydrogenase catalytic domain-containing protein [Gemmatimonadota bacterium]